jgi:phosphatidylcholine synthase
MATTIIPRQIKRQVSSIDHDLPASPTPKGSTPMRLRAAAVHLLTASGAVFALLALLATARGGWQEMFAWLGVALIVDAIDGPLARRVGVREILPRFSGERLDLIVDYLTYIAVPAFALTRAELLPEAWRFPTAAGVLLSSLFHMADQNSKTKEGYFVGFPAIWNVVLLYLFVFMPAPYLALAVVAVFIVLTFVPLLAVHPFRVAALRPFTLALTALWAVAAIGAAANPFPSPLWVKLLLAFTAIGLSAVGLQRALRDQRASR